MKQKFLIVCLIVFPLVAFLGLYFGLELKNQAPTQRINENKQPLEFQDNQVQCPQCAMYLVGKQHSVQLIDESKKTYFFDDIGCAILWLKDQKKELKGMTLWVYSLDTKRYIDGLRAHYLLGEETPMHYGFGAYENQHENTLGFEEMRLKMLRGENMTDPKIRQRFLEK